jgi:pimeloyl-ACP methyl ester carboxylesterase
MIFMSPVIWLMTRFLTFALTQTSKQLDYSTFVSTMTPPAVLASGCLGMFRYDVTKDLPEISVPTLIIAGDKDRLNAKLMTIAPGNH